MSKIICEICGTSYAETATQCPICGCVRPAETQGVPESDQGNGERTYTYVKGGRFSKANVRKRNAGKQVSTYTPDPVSSEDEDEKKSGKGLVITVIVLLLAIIAIVVYLAIRCFMPFFGVELPNKDTEPSESTAQTEDVTVPCNGVELDVYTVIFTQEGEVRLLDVIPDPADTTDSITFESADPSIATVTQDGRITAVAPGKTAITVSCGDSSAICAVECNFASTDDTTEATEETTEATEETKADEEFTLNRKDITFNRKGDTWKVYGGNIPSDKITWNTGNSAVATFKDGVVTAVGAGTTEISAEYEGKKVTCVIRCTFSDDSSVSGSGGGVSEDGGGAASGGASTGYKLKNTMGGNAADVTITVGYSFTLQLVDDAGNPVSGVTWATGNENCCTVSGGTITGVGAGMTTVTATYNGSTYSCIIRIG